MNQHMTIEEQDIQRRIRKLQMKVTGDQMSAQTRRQGSRSDAFEAAEAAIKLNAFDEAMKHYGHKLGSLEQERVREVLLNEVQDRALSSHTMICRAFQYDHGVSQTKSEIDALLREGRRLAALRAEKSKENTDERH